MRVLLSVLFSQHAVMQGPRRRVPELGACVGVLYGLAYLSPGSLCKLGSAVLNSTKRYPPFGPFAPTACQLSLALTNNAFCQVTTVFGVSYH